MRLLVFALLALALRGQPKGERMESGDRKRTETGDSGARSGGQ